MVSPVIVEVDEMGMPTEAGDEDIMQTLVSAASCRFPTSAVPGASITVTQVNLNGW
jgi:hypothetical protein